MNTSTGVSVGTCAPRAEPATRYVFYLQWITLLWMLVECGVSLNAAGKAHSPALLAFGSDSLVELLSAILVLFSVTSLVGRQRSSRWAGVLLYILAGVIGVVAVASCLFHWQPEPSRLGIAVTIAALVIMPILAWQKRLAARKNGDAALAADAVQSATCAYLAAIALAGLGANALFQIHWLDSVAALAILPLLCLEATRALRGQACGCC